MFFFISPRFLLVNSFGGMADILDSPVAVFAKFLDLSLVESEWYQKILSCCILDVR
jgi:hypothetical protein